MTKPEDLNGEHALLWEAIRQGQGATIRMTETISMIDRSVAEIKGAASFLKWAIPVLLTCIGLALTAVAVIATTVR